MYDFKIKSYDVGYISEISSLTAKPDSVTTRMTFNSSPGRIFRELMFYEEIAKPPPLFLRLLLPVPVGTEGRISQSGDVVMCMYKGGEHIQKRITRIVPNAFYEFEVTRQTLSLRGNIRLIGGCFRLCELPNGQTEVSVETIYYRTGTSPWYRIMLERKVCKYFHRYLLESIYEKIKTN